MTNHNIVSTGEWLARRKQLLDEEKQFTRLREQLAEKRRALPWAKVDKAYVFDGPKGQETLSDLFDGRSQLVVYHFMFAPEWDVGCKSCSFWADNFNGITAHLNQREVSFVAISRAPIEKLQAQQRRLGWSFKWLSSQQSEFNYDFRVSFTPDEVASGALVYNFGTASVSGPERQGISVFAKDGDAIFHTYSCYGRGVDMMNTAYQYLDLVPKGRDEQGLPYTMAWVKLRDQYVR
jgi:predicted dithiol-disulfide oxidoreductase (DUF899 family)